MIRTQQFTRILKIIQAYDEIGYEKLPTILKEDYQEKIQIIEIYLKNHNSKQSLNGLLERSK